MPIIDRTGHPVNEGVYIPTMRPRTGRRGSDNQLIQLLEDALENLSSSSCCFWACEGPTRPKHMITCKKCWAMRDVATVIASLKARI